VPPDNAPLVHAPGMNPQPLLSPQADTLHYPSTTFPELNCRTNVPMQTLDVSWSKQTLGLAVPPIADDTLLTMLMIQSHIPVPEIQRGYHDWTQNWQ